MVEAKVAKLGTGTRAMHKFGTTGYRYTYTQEVIFLRYQSVPDFPGGGEQDATGRRAE